MLELLLSVGGGFIFGSMANCVKEGVSFKPYHSKEGRAEIKQQRKEIREMVSTIRWSDKDADIKWHDR